MFWGLGLYYEASGVDPTCFFDEELNITSGPGPLWVMATGLVSSKSLSTDLDYPGGLMLGIRCLLWVFCRIILRYRLRT